MNINPSFSQTLQQQIDALPHAQKERLAFIDFSLQYFGHISRTELIARFRTGLAAATRDFAQYRSIAPENLVLCRNGNTIVIGQHSTIMLEAVALGAVVIEYQERGLPILQPLAPVSALSATKETFPNMLANIQQHIAEFDTKRIQKFIREEFGENLGKATETVVREIKKYL